MILFLAGLQRISPSLYEAAAMDGAQGWKVLRHITLPQLRATSTAVVLLLLINAFQAFDEFYNLLSSSGQYPPYARPPLVYLYYTALGQGQDFGHGSAGAVILALLIAVIALGQGRCPAASDSGRTDAWPSDPPRPPPPGSGPPRRYVALVRRRGPVPGALLPGAAQRAVVRGRHHRAGLDGCFPTTLHWGNIARAVRRPGRPDDRAACCNSVAISVTQTVGRADAVLARRLRPGPHPVPATPMRCST